MANPNRTVVHLVRHGMVDNPTEVIYGQMPGFHLSELGQQMAKTAAESLAGRDVTTIFSSPLERATETAESFSNSFGCPIEIDKRLIEPTNLFQGQRFAIGDGALRQPRAWWLLRNPFTPSWGEPYRQVAHRMRAVLAQARDQATGHEAVCISHQLPIEILRRSMKRQRLWHNPRNRMVTLASITSFVFQDEKLIDISYTEPAIDLVPPHLRARIRKWTN